MNVNARSLTISTGLVLAVTLPAVASAQMLGAPMISTSSAGLVYTSGISATTNQTSVTSLYASGLVGIGTTTPSRRLDVVGTMSVSGEYLNFLGRYSAGGLYSYAAGTLCYSTAGQSIASVYSFGACSSDRRLKKDITYLGDVGLNTIEKLKPAQFLLRKDPQNKWKAGFIAQDFKEAIPEAVNINADGVYSFDSTAVLSYSVKAIQELKADNDNLRAEFEAYKREHP